MPAQVTAEASVAAKTSKISNHQKPTNLFDTCFSLKQIVPELILNGISRSIPNQGRTIWEDLLENHHTAGELFLLIVRFRS
jgi:hypothetical protein